MIVLPPVSLFHNDAAFAPSTRSSPRFALHVAGLVALLAAVLDANARRVGFSAQTLPEVKDLRKDSKMTLDNSKPCLLTNYDWEIGVNIWRIFT
jgi:hypothetical protein